MYITIEPKDTKITKYIYLCVAMILYIPFVIFVIVINYKIWENKFDNSNKLCILYVMHM